MKEKINRFKVKGLGWVQINEHLVSFGHKDLPSDQHFTVSFNGTNDVEFHITKNTPNPKTKPKIPILVMERELIESDLESLFFTFLSGVLQRVDVEQLKKSSELKFVSFEELQKDKSHERTYQKFLDNFKDIAKIGKTRLIIDGDWGKRLEASVISDDMVDLLNNNLLDFDLAKKKEIDRGILLNEINGLQVLKIYDEWFEFKADLKPRDILSNIINPELIQRLSDDISTGINFLKTAKTNKDTEHLFPVRLIKKTEMPVVNKDCSK